MPVSINKNSYAIDGVQFLNILYFLIYDSIGAYDICRNMQHQMGLNWLRMNIYYM